MSDTQGVSEYQRLDRCPEVLTLEQAALFLSVSPALLTEWIARDRAQWQAGIEPANPLPVLPGDRAKLVRFPARLLLEWFERECTRRPQSAQRWGRPVVEMRTGTDSGVPLGTPPINGRKGGSK